MRPLAAAAALLVLATTAAAQERAADLLARAKTLYDRFEVERAVPLLREVLSPARVAEVTRAERVEASKYLGAAHALMGQRDSAIGHFRTAIAWDPFADLEPTRFTPAQLDAFAAARRSTFAVALRPVAPARLEARGGALTLTVLTTHAARLRAELGRLGDGGDPTVLWDGENDGVRELRWGGGGFDAPGRTVAPGRYRIRVVAESRLAARAESAFAYFDLSVDGPALEDTLPDLGPRDLLPETREPSAARSDLLKGLAVAAGALFIAALGHDDLGNSNAEAGVVAGAATLTGVAAVALRRSGAPIAANVAENQRRRAARRAINDATVGRNRERLSQTTFIISPATGTEP